MPTTNKISYDPEANVLAIELHPSAPVAAALEVGNTVIHVTAANVPVLIEILNATTFITELGGLVNLPEPRKDLAV